MRRRWLRAFTAFIVVMLLILAGLAGYVDYNQKKILKDLVTQLNKNVRGKLSIEKISLTIFSEFPNLSVTLDNGVVKDSLNRQEIFRAGKIYCRINPFKLIFKQIDVRSVIIQNANIFLQQDSQGLNAANLFIKSTDTSKGPLNISFNIKELKIANLQLSFNDEVRNKHVSLKAQNMLGNIREEDSSFMVQLRGFIHTDSMLFKADKGSFLFNRDAHVNLDLNYNKYFQQLTINPSPVEIDEQHYAISGYFHFAQKPARLKLLITDSAVNFDKGRQVLSSKILLRLKNISVPEPVNVSVLIEGPMLPDMPPAVDANFTIKHGRIKYYAANLTEVNMTGLFMNHVKPGVKNDDANSELVFDFAGAKINGIPCTANLSVVDLKALHAEVTAAVNTPLTAFNQTLGNDSANFRFKAGNALINIHYKGTIYYYLDTIKSNFDDTLHGKILLTNGALDYSKGGIEISDIQTDIAFTQKQVDLKKISCAINGNAVNIAGSVTSVRRIVSGEVEKMVGNLKITAPKFDLNKIQVLKKTDQPAHPVASVTSAQASKITALLDTITNMLSINLSVKCDEFIFRQLNACNVTADINASSEGLQVRNFNLNMCQGRVIINGALNTVQNSDRVICNAQIDNIDVKQFLYDLDNFDQTTIQDNNITGRLNAQLDFASPLKSDYNIIADSMKGTIRFSLRNGSLVQFQPLVNVGKKIFKNRDFTHVAFAEIKDTVDLHDNTLFLHKMEISSSVLRLFMQGRFSFNGSCDLAIQVPLGNLKKQEINYEPENIGLDAKAGPCIFLHVTGDKNNKVKIALDPTARQRMKKGVSAKKLNSR